MKFELKDAHLDHLKRIRKLRNQFTLRVYGGLLMLPVFIMFVTFLGDPEPFNLSRFSREYYHIFIFSVFLFSLGAIPVLITFLRKFYPLTKDIHFKTGLKINKQIIRKQHFQLTNEYFLFFHEQDMPNIKVDMSTFKHYKVGDYFSILTAKHSKVVFEDYDRFDIV